jgi:hypothetical protein
MTGDYRILVTGSRDWTDTDLIRDALMAATVDVPDARVVVVHGGAGGADTIADRLALRLGWRREPHPADWARYGRRAGPLRNDAMVALGADLCLAFILDRSPGASHCWSRARYAGIPDVPYHRSTP